MKLTNVPCQECGFSFQDIELTKKTDGYYKHVGECPNCNHPVEIIVHVYDPSKLPF